MDKGDKFIFHAAFLVGILFAGIDIGRLGSDSSLSEGRVYKHNEKNVLHLNRPFQRDAIYIEDSPGKYITEEKYLRNIKDEYDRKIEETQIEKLVNPSESGN